MNASLSSDAKSPTVEMKSYAAAFNDLRRQERDTYMVIDESPRAEAQPRVFLQPIAAPSILGLYG
jgi:hypothetical protein